MRITGLNFNQQNNNVNRNKNINSSKRQPAFQAELRFTDDLWMALIQIFKKAYKEDPLYKKFIASYFKEGETVDFAKVISDCADEFAKATRKHKGYVEADILPNIEELDMKKFLMSFKYFPSEKSHGISGKGFLEPERLLVWPLSDRGIRLRTAMESIKEKINWNLFDQFITTLRKIFNDPTVQ